MNSRGFLPFVLILLTIVFASATVYEYDQVVNFSAQLQSRTQTEQCIRTGSGYAFHVRVVADGTHAPISGAKVNAISYTTCASGTTEWGSPISTMTPENGTVALSAGGIGGYNIIVAYQGASYSVGDVFIAPVQTTTATLSIISGNATITHSAHG